MPVASEMHRWPGFGTVASQMSIKTMLYWQNVSRKCHVGQCHWLMLQSTGSIGWGLAQGCFDGRRSSFSRSMRWLGQRCISDTYQGDGRHGRMRRGWRKSSDMHAMHIGKRQCGKDLRLSVPIPSKKIALPFSSRCNTKWQHPRISWLRKRLGLEHLKF